ncbi:triphosphoribosyl-dephospho-CoA synthase CitG [Acerihabitans arboris]|uniref:Probable 2-(5''-triphosphoribosyl)-3'-dephosphocoenzyme-A synthase n=1 Tax=Acerihabitans arboris TaxID=2691583 RepID=A0A845SLJ1_9GAMM|nr:triphosphoribosyl-dephospho-CoA synthase CitG [Acerihabitans arboris]NDL63438.1 triphosphoribosyl-dephospho-CoA synthase CitG [Acerihabitans arboris]
MMPLPAIDLLATAALREEVMLTPKPGLVDSRNNGAHRDMDLALFMQSITAIAPWFGRFAALGERCADMPAQRVLAEIRPTGLACEQAMFAATGGVNTHKGGVFSLGLLCAAGGRLAGRGQALTRRGLCADVAAICARLVATELAGRRKPATVGERLYLRHGLTGARGEAAGGFATVRRYALPAWDRLSAAGADRETALLHCLLVLMAHNPDTNLVSRGGLDGLQFVRRYARRLLDEGWRPRALEDMDRALIGRNLSPGGSADLLAVTAVLARFPA